MQQVLHRRALYASLNIAKKELGLDEDTYRAAMKMVTGKVSAKDCSEAELKKLSAHFQAKGFTVKSKKRFAVKGPAAKHVAKITALWMSGYQLGVIKKPDPQAMEAFIARVTGIARAQWLVNIKDANKVIEGLKSWLSREGQVDWSFWKGVDSIYNEPIYRVVLAQHAKLVMLTDPAEDTPSMAVIMESAKEQGRLSISGLQEISKAMGEKIRGKM